jgi:hypothetical protein
MFGGPNPEGRPACAALYPVHLVTAATILLSLSRCLKPLAVLPLLRRQLTRAGRPDEFDHLRLVLEVATLAVRAGWQVEAQRATDKATRPDLSLSRGDHRVHVEARGRDMTAKCRRSPAITERSTTAAGRSEALVAFNALSEPLASWSKVRLTSRSRSRTKPLRLGPRLRAHCRGLSEGWILEVMSFPDTLENGADPRPALRRTAAALGLVVVVALVVVSIHRSAEQRRERASFDRLLTLSAAGEASVERAQPRRATWPNTPSRC